MERYLDSLKIQYARVSRVFKNTLPLQFRNQEDQDNATGKLEDDLFNEQHHLNFMNDQPQ